MSFASPLELFWLIPAWGAITALYLLRRPRRNIDVPSTLFWSSRPQESLKRAKLQRFTPQLLYVVQMLAALLLVLALMQPQVSASIPVGSPIAVVIDNGITSQATDMPGTRLSAEKAVALTLLSEPGLRNARPIIVTTAPPMVLAGLSGGEMDTVSAIRRIRVSDAASDVPGAISSAASALHALVKPGQAPQILLVSDMAWPPEDDRAAMLGAQDIALYAYRIASLSAGRAQDAAIMRLAAQRDSIDPDHLLDIYVQLGATAPVRGAVLTLQESGYPTIERRLDLSAGPPVSVAMQILAPARSEGLTAQLSVPAGFADCLPIDNTAYAVLPPAGGLHVLLVTPGDSALASAIGILPGVSLTQITPAQYAAGEGAGAYDVSVFDGAAPSPNRPVSGGEMLWGSGDASFTAPPGNAPSLQSVVDWNRSAEVMRFLDLSTTSLIAQRWNRVGDWTPLIETGSGIVAASTDLGGTRKICMSFLPSQSGFESNPAFPIFINNAVQWLAQSSGDESDLAGVPIVLPPIQGGWTVTAPDAAQTDGVCAAGSACAFDRTGIHGLYTAVGGGRRLLFVRNCPPTALQLDPRQHVLGSRSVDIVGHPSLTHLGGKQGIENLAIAVCIFSLLGEWLLYHRPLARFRKRTLQS